MRRWIPFALLTPFQFIFGLVYSWGTIAPAIHAQSAWPQATLDLAFSLTPLGLLPAVILAGHALQRLAPKTLLALALACFTLGGGIGLLVARPVPFMLGYSLLALGVGAGLSTAACIAMVSRFYPQRRGSLGGALLALYGLSSMISAPLFGEINRHLGWRPSLAALLAVYAVVGWTAWAFLPEGSASQIRRVDAQPLHVLLRKRPLRRALVIVLLATPLGSASFATIGHLTEALDIRSAAGMLAVPIMALGNGLGRLGFGLLADWFSPRFSRTAALGLNASTALLLLAVLHGLGVWAFAAYPLLIGLAFGGIAGKLPAMAAHVAQRHAEAAFGLLFGAFALSSFFGPLLSADLGMHAALHWLALSALVAMGLGLVAAK